MEAYTGFAEVYDLFMDNVPYEKWCENIVDILKSNGIEDGLVLELGCGTGKMTRLLSEAGYDMIGVDISEEMLAIAQEQNTDGKILYLNQDMREFELYGTVRAVVCVCDSINYILEDSDMEAVFKLVNNYLDPGGLFVFDINTVYKYEKLLGDTTICENRPIGSFIWENFYDETEHINEYDLTIYVKGEDELYERFEEVHYQRAYYIEELKKLITDSGMTYLNAFPVDMGEGIPGKGEDQNIEESCEKIYITAREKGK
ncbi:MAG: class I SAM-dependent methyltransferase [Lachnospiraceae bacterium]|nr:class I SAM-dependent methyltransferase [Lachnospiraceae bacterium]